MNTKRFSLLCMLLGLFLIIYGIYISYIIPQCQSGKSPQIQQTATINDISLGMRTVGTNPQGKTVDEIGEPNSSWFQIKLRMVKQNQGVLNIELLRPQEWLHAHNVFPGNIIPMDMPEMGAVGGAEVLSVSSAPPIQSGKGNVVSGKFIHEATNCIDLHIEGHGNPIGCTDNHPFWSEDRQEFIPAGELNQGERVLLYSGETAKIAQKLPRPGPETVYNLEIWGEHVYCVGNNGVLVHNMCGRLDFPGYYLAKKAPMQVIPGVRELRGVYVNDIGIQKPWIAHYDKFGRLKARTDYNAGNIRDNIPDTHFHVYEWGPGKNPLEVLSHIPGEYLP